MKKIVLLILSALVFGGCAGTQTTIGDGVLQENEAAAIRVAVGVAMAAQPKTIAPAYAVSTAVLAIMDGQQAVPVSDLEGKVMEEVDKLQLTPNERASMLDLINMVKVQIKTELGLTNADADQRLLLVKQVIKIVQESARYRLGIQ